MNKWQQSKQKDLCFIWLSIWPGGFLYFVFLWTVNSVRQIAHSKIKSKLIDHYLVHFVCFAFFFSLTSIDFFVFVLLLFFLYFPTDSFSRYVLIWCSTVFCFAYILLIWLFDFPSFVSFSMKHSSVHMLDDFVRIQYLLFMSHIKPSFYFATRIDSFMICFLLLIIGCQMYCACLFSCVFFSWRNKKKSVKV